MSLAIMYPSLARNLATITSPFLSEIGYAPYQGVLSSGATAESVGVWLFATAGCQPAHV